MACTSSCETQDHRSYGACLKSKGVRSLYLNSQKGFDATKEKKWNKELDAYESALRQGVQPAGTSTAKIEQAMQISEATGVAFDAGAN